MKTIILITFTFLVHAVLNAQDLDKKKMRVVPNGHDLQYEDGRPFFWLGDTGWELFHRLNLAEIREYLDNRSAKGFTVIQAVALAEFDGLHTPNRYGERPFINDDPTKPNDRYFAIIDSTIEMAGDRNMFIGLLPTWGDKVTLEWGIGPVVFDTINAYHYGKWLGERYKVYKNIIWILGGDRPAMTDKDDWRSLWRAMARGIGEATQDSCLITYHPSGGNISTSQWFHEEKWLGLNMLQSGHGSGHDVANWETISYDRTKSPPKPTLDAEPNYEDHPVNPWPKWDPENGYYRDYDVRKQCYRSVFAGACGVTYGHHAIWQFMGDREEVINFADRGWRNAMDRPGAFQMGYLRNLMESRPMQKRVPDFTIVAGDKGENAVHMEAFRGDENGYAMIYLPIGRTVEVNTSFMKARQVKTWWYNPKNGEIQQIGTMNRLNSMAFTSPTEGEGNDWVLIIDDVEKKYAPPGT